MGGMQTHVNTMCVPILENEGWVWFLVKASQGEICLHVIDEKGKDYRQTIQDWMAPPPLPPPPPPPPFSSSFNT
ncbi:hypothetical protein VNO78_06210 [Psophocarpus tetragonolobus]|uniref:Uncharacterized protein n=1 Tax=Psophocarpus tetragonolobus TaxID=3891 RepID=A0AAN9T0Z2_PSOTE